MGVRGREWEGKGGRGREVEASASEETAVATAG